MCLISALVWLHKRCYVFISALISYKRLPSSRIPAKKVVLSALIWRLIVY